MVRPNVVEEFILLAVGHALGQDHVANLDYLLSSHNRDRGATIKEVSVTRRVKSNLHPISGQDGVICNLIRLLWSDWVVLAFHSLDGILGLASSNAKSFFLVPNTKSHIFDGRYAAVANNLARRGGRSFLVDGHDKHAVPVESRDIQTQANGVTCGYVGINLFPLGRIQCVVDLFRRSRLEGSKVNRDGPVSVDKLIKLLSRHQPSLNLFGCGCEFRRPSGRKLLLGPRQLVCPGQSLCNSRVVARHFVGCLGIKAKPNLLGLVLGFDVF